MPGIGFLLQACTVIDFSKPTIELKQGAAKSLNDFSLSSMAGRVGQGLAILYGHELGLKFSAHLRSHVESLPEGSAGAAHKSEAMADFLFADNQRTVLIESKGSFSQQINDPSPIKKVLKAALRDQIDPWMLHLQPTPSNGYVIYSCIRESVPECSAMFVVDPPGDNVEPSDVPLSIEMVMRENYGAWLRAMGLGDSADRLLNTLPNDINPATYRFLVTETGGRKFAFLAEPHAITCLDIWSCWGIGIDYFVLQAISSVIQSSDASLQELLTNSFDLNEFSQSRASIFPDGSVLGSIHFNAVHFVEVLL
ncbi:TPA: hypothetical protein VDV39_001541 [Pseudomonas aeruginosa]|nr:hypothetical protein [Pseudomonas aeruginosa]HEP9306395.1 hypothetical protein [Pseudomonas aeruginosa]